MPIKTLIVDDDHDSIEILEHFINQWNDFQIVGHCEDGDQIVDNVINKNPDFILLDIKMPSKNGMDAIKECLKIDKNLKFIFVTGYGEYAVDAFSVSASDYIVKPIDKNRLYQGLSKVKNEILKEEQEQQKKFISIKFNGITYLIPLEDIIFIEKSGKKSLIYTTTEVYKTYDSISNIFSTLNDDFFQSHRSYIVNINHISHITPINDTFIIYFKNINDYAHLSKLRVQDLHNKLKEIAY